MRLLFMEVCLFLSFTFIETSLSQPQPCLLSILHMVSSSLKRQQDAAPALSMLADTIKVTC